ncbi:hypothetical protein V5O48_007526 [Marasmius crinis-equi]|uniref:4-hydroxybenzoate polyprenyltransferase, mitochondrial n=1 Tax=Marasmius crinis-equi TaxID=585013 RepID=A0ABR3FE00_9AGAR
MNNGDVIEKLPIEQPLQAQADSKHKRSPLAAFPVSWHPYLELMRIDKPTGTKLMFWPFAWGLTMAAYSSKLPLEEYGLDLLKCLFGAFIVRSSACTINDIFDRDMDAGVERTKGRPLASGRVTAFNATVFVLLQYTIGILFFYLTVSGLALWVALFQLLPMFAIYPLLKRVTYWPQAWLGFAMNFGFITAWVSTLGTVNIPLFISVTTGCWCWTMLYDTIYACQDIEDDVKMGVRSTAILFGTWIRPLLIGCGITFTIMLSCAGVLNDQGLPFFVISVGGTAAHLVWQYRTVDLAVPASCWQNFMSNGQLGWIVWGGMMADYVLRGVVLPSYGVFAEVTLALAIENQPLYLREGESYISTPNHTLVSRDLDPDPKDPKDDVPTSTIVAAVLGALLFLISSVAILYWWLSRNRWAGKRPAYPFANASEAASHPSSTMLAGGRPPESDEIFSMRPVGLDLPAAPSVAPSESKNSVHTGSVWESRSPYSTPRNYSPAGRRSRGSASGSKASSSKSYNSKGRSRGHRSDRDDGGGSSAAGTQTVSSISFAPATERQMEIDELIEEMKGKLALFQRTAPTMRIRPGSAGSNGTVSLAKMTHDYRVLQWKSRIEKLTELKNSEWALELTDVVPPGLGLDSKGAEIG